MTCLVACVRDAAEAAAVVAAGIDRLLIRAPHPTPLDMAGLRAIADAAHGQCPIALWLTEPDPAVVEALFRCDADQLWGRPDSLPPSAPVPRWAVLAADAAEVGHAVALGCEGVVIGAGPAPGRLLETTSIEALEDQLRGAKHRGLAVAFTGTMEAPDVPRLLALGPDALVLDGLLRRNGKAEGALDAQRLRLARGLVPVETTRPVPAISAVPGGHDRIFVRDWTLAIRLGAYVHERAPQRVRFSIEAEVERGAARPADMRDVVTYDLITDAIGRATVGHVELVETIAEDIAALILVHPRVLGVDVTVEKLDLGPGSLGCRILRRRAG